MTNDEGSPNVQMTKPAGSRAFHHSGLFACRAVAARRRVIPSSVGIRHFLRRQSLDQPTATNRLASVTKAIVQAVRTTLPEFDHIRFYSVAAPVRR
jgi:hypothetical protein